MVFFKKYFDKHLTFNENCVYYNHKRKQGRFGLTEVPFFYPFANMKGDTNYEKECSRTVWKSCI